jgi:cation:H+ antiporter
MEICLNIFLFLIGLALLILASSWLIQGCVKLSFLLKLTPLFIGLVVVAFGTSTPEAGVGIVAAIRNQRAIALGNVLGSNIANIGLVLGVCALFRPFSIDIGDRYIFKKEIPVMLLSVVLLYILGMDLVIGRLDGLVLILFFALFCSLSYKGARGLFNSEEIQNFELDRSIQKLTNKGIISLLILVSFFGIFMGARLMVEGGVNLARIFGISPWIIAITIFAIGTSLPELATSLTASLRKVHSISIGNIVGSNIFNILFVLGIVSLIRPITLEVPVLVFEFPALVCFSLLLFMIMKTGYKITRTEGLVMFLAYLGFIILLIK